MVSQKVKLKTNAYSSLLKLINIQFWRNSHSIFFVYFFPIIFIGIWGYLSISWMGGNSSKYFMEVIIGIITFQIVSSGIQQIPSAIMEFKNSVLLKRIGATPIKPIDFIICTVSLYLMLIILQIIWIIMWVTIIFGFYKFSDSKNGIDILYKGNVQWVGFIISEMYIVLLSCVVGVFVSSITKTSSQANAISMIFFFVSMLLSGQLIPVIALDNIGFFKVVSWMTPFRYGNQLTFMAWNGINIFNANEWIANIIGYKIEPWMGWVSWFMPLVYFGLFTALSVWKFKWYVR